ncbi:hypothetical protein ACFYS8_00795 [Kitasatospora sp. NPDC004615]|uniref:hypothetical protein n=1 Tax=Kitasatospora sp. NPDC004615 TaxID=3364017 RepID=UPI0036ACED9B
MKNVIFSPLTEPAGEDENQEHEEQREREWQRAVNEVLAEAAEAGREVRGRRQWRGAAGRGVGGRSQRHHRHRQPFAEDLPYLFMGERIALNTRCAVAATMPAAVLGAGA